MRFCSWVSAVSLASLSVFVFACAAEGTGGSLDGDAAVGSGGSDATGQGGAGGGGGEGGDMLPCGIDCSGIVTDACHTAICDETSKQCAVVDAVKGTPCDDGLFCTVADTCDAGQCVGGPANDCALPLDNCQVSVCDEQKKSCSAMPAGDGIPCMADDLCTVNSACINGLCVGAQKDCFFAPVPDACHNAVCNPATGACDPVPGNDGVACTDNSDLCSVNNTCLGGVCSGGVPKNCSALTQDCLLGVCDALTGQCGQVPLNEGDLCDDLDPCTNGEICQAGLCTNGGLVTTCIANDFCCPAACDENTDVDCILTVLLLGDDVLAADWDAYRNALTASGLTWAEHNLDLNATFPDLATLSQYNTLVWFDENTITPDNAEAQIVADWLALGGRNLFVTGVDFMWDFQSGTVGQGEKNLYNLWGTTYIGDYCGTAVATLDGVANDPIMAPFVAPNGLTLVQGSDSDGDYASELIGPATHGGIYGPGGTGSGHSGLSHYNGGGYKVVWLGVNYHNGLTNPGQRNTLMANIASYFKN